MGFLWSFSCIKIPATHGTFLRVSRTQELLGYRWHSVHVLLVFPGLSKVYIPRVGVIFIYEPDQKKLNQIGSNQIRRKHRNTSTVEVSARATAAPQRVLTPWFPGMYPSVEWRRRRRMSRYGLGVPCPLCERRLTLPFIVLRPLSHVCGAGRSARQPRHLGVFYSTLDYAVKHVFLAISWASCPVYCVQYAVAYLVETTAFFIGMYRLSFSEGWWNG